jgi:hypothetical protein
VGGPGENRDGDQASHHGEDGHDDQQKRCLSSVHGMHYSSEDKLDPCFLGMSGGIYSSERAWKFPSCLEESNKADLQNWNFYFENKPALFFIKIEKNRYNLRLQQTNLTILSAILASSCMAVW